MPTMRSNLESIIGEVEPVASRLLKLVYERLRAMKLSRRGKIVRSKEGCRGIYQKEQPFQILRIIRLAGSMGVAAWPLIR